MAGETSGDILGGRLMTALKSRVADVRFVGVGGEEMLREGLESRAELSRLAVNGFVDPIKRLPDLISILMDLYRHFVLAPVDVVVGVDFNVFNLLLERMVKRQGIPTAHYVSPSVYFWRRGRIKRIGKSADTVLALYPFEPALYTDRGVRATFVGHPLADEIDPDAGSDRQRAMARAKLGIGEEKTVFAVMPGSRMSEITYLGDIFLATANRLADAFEGAVFAIPCVDDRIRGAVEQRLVNWPRLDVRLVRGDSKTVLTACDAALVKSGTGTLEALLLRRPMVVSYRLGTATYHLVNSLRRSKFVALPNILAGRELVPELLQDDAQPDRLARALLSELERSRTCDDYFDDFERIHRTLRLDASVRAADAVLELVGGEH
ncbi:MAG: lipid-A-disaccharide synthase [Gammaproteobacteria bacterium]|nr:lipid-A-disaccharide synthase [Gammaproteobacteria bacterium]